MTQTIRRELRQKFIEIVENEDLSPNQMADMLADAAIELRAFKTPTARIDRTEEEQEELDRKKTAWLFPASQAEVESCLHFNPLPWSSNREWERLEKFVVAEYRKDKNIWQRYDTWRKGDGKYAGYLSNKAIKYRPDDFIACFPDFLAHTAMYGKKSGAEVKVDADGAPITW